MSGTIALRLRFVLRASLLVLLTILLSCQLAAQESDRAEVQDPSSIRNITLTGGYLNDLSGGDKSKGYYRFEINGGPIKEAGTPFTSRNLSEPLTQPPKKGVGDSKQFTLRLEDGLVETDGPILEALDIRPFSVKGRFIRELRGALQVSGQIDGDLSIAAGLETPPFHPLSGLLKYRGANGPNWLILGLQEERLEDSSVGSTKNRGLATYRSFVGQGYRWVASEKSAELRKKLPDLLVQKAPTFAEAESLSERILTRIGKGKKLPDDSDSIIVNAYLLLKDTPPSSPAEWQDYLRAAAGSFTMPRDQPTYAVWFDAAGWYVLNGETTGEKRFNNALGLTLKYWLNPEEDGSRWLELRYEIGRVRAAPTERKHFLALSYGFQL